MLLPARMQASMASPIAFAVFDDVFSDRSHYTTTFMPARTRVLKTGWVCTRLGSPTQCPCIVVS